MAVAIYHGAAGSYKTASAVWFRILPALRAGRVVVTNIEGMKSVEEIERNLGERFPMSAKIIRILSNNEKGLFLWQNFYSWCPLGALIVIDEAQDIYNKTVGFDLVKNKLLDISTLADYLPSGYLDYYSRVFDSFICPDPFIDDAGFSTVDSFGRPVLPLNYNSALMTHRHFNWDIYYLTPSISQIDSSVRGVCEKGFHHSNKDGTVNRRPRVWEHDPKSTSTKPDKDAVVTYTKIPLDVHLMYSSTATGAITKSGLGRSLFKNWKLWMVIIILLSCFSLLVYTLDDYRGLGYDNSDVDSSQSFEKDMPGSSSSSSVVVDSSLSSRDTSPSSLSSKTSDSVSSSVPVSQSIAQATVFLNSKLNGLAFDFGAAFISSSQKIINKGNKYYHYLINYKDNYFDSYELALMGFQFTYVSDCLAYVSHGGVGRLLSCDRNVKSWTFDFKDTVVVDDAPVSNSILKPGLSPILDIVSN